MKTFFALCLALLAVSAAEAQIFRPQPVNGSVVGRREHRNDSRGGDYIYRSPQGRAGNDHGGGYRNFGYGSGHYGHGSFNHSRSYGRHGHSHGGFGYHGGRYGYSYYPRIRYIPSYGDYGGYGYGYPYYDSYGYYGSTSAATNGLLLGALAGGIIGHNSGDLRHSAWRGSAWGAGLGWVLGSVVDANRRSVAYAPAPVVVQQAPVVQSQAQPAAAAQPQQVTIINNYYNSSTPMGAANGMFGR
jgi:hypothetical protein